MIYLFWRWKQNQISSFFTLCCCYSPPPISFSGINERTNTDCGRCTSAPSVRIRGYFCPYLSGITRVLPIRLQSRAGASGSSQVSGCPGLALMIAYREALPSILRRQETFDIALQRTAAEALGKILNKPRTKLQLVFFFFFFFGLEVNNKVR